MIISASRRTDIPAHYFPWFLERLRAGFVEVRNPMNPRQVSRIGLSPEAVDGIVFWTKNPTPMLDKLDTLDSYMYYVQFTVTSYGRDVEPGVPSKNRVIVPAFQRLAEKLGPERVIWRYDPIFLTPVYNMDYHLRWFEALAKRLAPCTRQCTVSFLDYYRGTAGRLAPLSPLPFPPEQQGSLAGRLAEIARGYGLEMKSCAEEADLSRYGIGHASCIDGQLFERLLGRPLNLKKDRSQRPACGCAASRDIGAYDTCPNGCLYCYANHSEKALRENLAGFSLGQTGL